MHVGSGLGIRGVTITSNDRGKHHQNEGTQGHGGDLTTKPQHFTVSNQDDGQVLEDGVDRDGQVGDGLGGSIDHGHKEQSNWEPLLGFLGVELSVGDDVGGLQGTNDNDTGGGLHGQEEEVQLEVTGKHVLVSDGHQDGRSTVTQDRHWARVGDGRRSAADGGITRLFHFFLYQVDCLSNKIEQNNSHALVKGRKKRWLVVSKQNIGKRYMYVFWCAKTILNTGRSRGLKGYEKGWKILLLGDIG